MFKLSFFLFFVLICQSTIAQKQTRLNVIVNKAMDDNAAILLNESKAYSVSIGIVKDGKTYIKHFGEIDKGKKNQATNDTYFEIASVTKVMTGYMLKPFWKRKYC